MSANGDAARRDMRDGRMGRCLAADMTVKERCALSKVAELCSIWATVNGFAQIQLAAGTATP